MLYLVMEDLFIDRRKYKRVKAAVEILITIRVNELEHEHCIVTGKTVDISANGILFTYDAEIPVDTPIMLTFFPPDSDRLIDVKGRIKRVEKNGEQYNLAVEFIDLKQQQITMLDQILNGE